jgi:hypothetical protein
VDFKKQLMPYSLNLRTEPILFEQIYSNWASCICTLCSTFCIFFQTLGALTLYAMRPALVNSTPGCVFIETGLVQFFLSLEVFKAKTFAFS